MARLTLVAMRGAANAVYKVRILARIFANEALCANQRPPYAEARPACHGMRKYVRRTQVTKKEVGALAGWRLCVCVFALMAVCATSELE